MTIQSIFVTFDEGSVSNRVTRIVIGFRQSVKTLPHLKNKRVKIPEQANKYPGQLSGGQQQRVAIARSLCMKPRILLFDEPTSALDPEMESLVSEILKEMAEKGACLILVAHRPRMLELADEVLTMG